MNPCKLSLLILASTLLWSCHTHNQNTHIPEASASSLKNNVAASPALELVNNYSVEELEFSPLMATYIGIQGYNHLFLPEINESNRTKRMAFEQKYRQLAAEIDSSKLSAQDQLTLQIFKNDREMFIERAQFNGHLLPINQMYGVHNNFAELGSGESPQPFSTTKDYRNFIQRAEGFARWVDSAIAAMKQGMTSGLVQPKAIVNKIIPQLKVHLVSDIKSSIFYTPINKMPDSISGKTRQTLIADYEQCIVNTIIPAYQRLHDFMLQDYLPAARDSVGLSDLPQGESWYQHMIKVHTTLSLSADEIHDYGLQEVSRILDEMNQVKTEVKFQGDMPAFFQFLRSSDQFYFNSADELVQAYVDVKKRIDAKLPQMFEVFPKSDYEVRPVPDFRAASAPGASYEAPAADGSRPGIFYINTFNLKSQPKFIMETLSIHEAAPGHHFQIAIQQEVEGLPDYRKFGGYTVFNEGWALYAESLGKELGLFTDPYMWYGRLVDEQLRAMRLVVDTGLHAKGWSREQAIDYMLANSSMARSDVEAEVERYLVIPGQALAYKIGQRAISQLRKSAEQALGSQFDIKKFHTQLLIDGSLPIPLLEQKIKRWVLSQK